MMLTAKGRYAVMAMVDIASQVLRQEDRPVSLAEISDRQGITVAYLEQIFSRLRCAGLVCSVRGPGGGYRLNMEPADISVADIVTAVDEDIKMTRCDHNSESGCMTSNARCLTHDLWDGLGNHIYAFLLNTTLFDICTRQVNLFPEGAHGILMEHQKKQLERQGAMN